MERIGFTASEEMSFEKVDRWRTTTTDGQRMPTYTISSPMSLRLRWAKKHKFEIKEIGTYTVHFIYSYFMHLHHYYKMFCKSCILIQAGFFKKPRLGVSHFTWRRQKKKKKKRNWCVRPGVSCPVPVFSRHDSRANSTLSALQLEVRKNPFP